MGKRGWLVLLGIGLILVLALSLLPVFLTPVGWQMMGPGMMGGGWMGVGMMGVWVVLGGLVLLLVIGGLGFAGVGLLRSGAAGPQPLVRETPREILERRYAAGEITPEQFQRMKQDLGG